MTIRKHCRLVAASLAGLLAVTGCNDFLEVENPNFVAGTDLDPQSDATTLALSALQDLAASYGTYTVFGGIFTGELYSADVNANGNLFSVRLVNETMTNPYYASMSRARVLATKVVAALEETPAETSLNAARAWAVSGYAFLSLAEYFCSGSVDGGPELSTAALYDSATVNLTKAITVATAVGAPAASIRNMALVGRARAHLAVARKAEAIADAAAVPAGFRYDLLYINDLTALQRLGNSAWYYLFNIGNISVAPPFRSLSDPRVATVSPTVNGLKPMDGATDMWSPAKYPGYAAPVRLASKLEADYVAAEAQGTTAMLALVQARRAELGLQPYAGETSDRAVLVEFLTQRAYEFFLEGKRMGDYRRHPNAIPFLVPAGTPYRKANVPAYSDGKCWPIPIQERQNNPNF